MATRTGRLNKPDRQGQYVRQLGWKRNDSGRKIQHKFRLGSDRREAERRDGLLRQLWEKIEGTTTEQEPLWNEFTLDLARAIAKGIDRIPLPPLSEEETPGQYAKRLQAIQDRFPFLRFQPTEEQRYAQGIGELAFELKDLLITGTVEDLFPVLKQKELLAPPLRPSSETNHMLIHDYQPQFAPQNHASPSQPPDDGATLHEALERYADWIRTHYFDNDLNDITEHAHTKLGQVQTLKSRHDDVPLVQIDYNHIEGMYRFWRQRPYKTTRNGRQDRISHSSIRHYIGELHRFFKWLHRSSEFTWRKPEDFDDIDRRVPQDTETVKQRIRNVDTFRLEELQLLNRYATPIERLYLMLGLNCGFGAKEIATLTIGEVFLHQALSAEEQEVFHFPSSTADSFVSLVRNKTTIVGKYLLFQQTTKMLEWCLARRLQQPNPSPDQRLILTSKGKPLDQRSLNGNPSRQIPNTFARLKKRIRDDHNQLSDLPFKCLRKTAGDLIRRFSDGEVAGVFLLHGQPVKADKLSDVYTNRPFGKVYQAIQKVESFLQPVFDEVPNDPTAKQPQSYTPRKLIDHILELHQQGASIREIADATGKSRMTVHRHLEKSNLK
ncbi:MAG: helix-turn-helix domain-containing protein [Gimesia chilikensis]|uniref:helix-turn-helix domain-containing protein n=1 Tax=Gimesia chilikensis TaxID=2605989 RepID=UPI0037AD9D98